MTVRISRILVLVMAGWAMGSTGCSSTPKTAAGTGIGAALGTGAGLAIGAATGNPKTGALAGGLIGAGVGGAIGASEDAKDRERVELAQASSQPTTSGPLSMSDVITMASGPNAVGDDVIINYIRQTHSTFQLTPSDIATLKQNHVSDRVVNEMINSQSRVGIRTSQPKTVIVQEPAPTTIIYERPYYGRPYYWGPPPPPPMGIGFTYIRR